MLRSEFATLFTFYQSPSPVGACLPVNHHAADSPTWQAQAIRRVGGVKVPGGTFRNGLYVTKRYGPLLLVTQRYAFGER